MATFESAIKRIKELQKKMQGAGDSYVASPEFKKLGETAVDLIVRRTMLGKGVRNPGGPVGKFLPLADSTIELRKRYRKNLKTGFTTTSRSNLTATGQLLDSIFSRVTNKRIKISFKDTRTRELSGARSRIKNSDVASYVQDKRPFFNFSGQDRKTLQRIARADILKILRKV